MQTCRKCIHWAAEPENDTNFRTCAIPLPVFDLPVRDLMWDDSRQIMRWMETGEVIPNGGGGKIARSHADYCCDHWRRRAVGTV